MKNALVKLISIVTVDAVSYGENVSKMLEIYSVSSVHPGLKELWKLTFAGRRKLLTSESQNKDNISDFIKNSCPVLNDLEYVRSCIVY